MLRYMSESLALFLIALLPFHAFFVTVGTRLLLGQGHAPLPILATWKEVVLGVVIALSVIEIVRKLSTFNFQFSTDILDWLVLGLVGLGLMIPSSNFVFGFKYTLFPLCLFLILRRVSWSEEFVQRVWKVILVVGGVIAGYGIFTFFLPLEFFTWLGYSDLHSLYLPDGPLAAFQQIGGTSIRRIQSTMSGPNQFGVWLLIPWSIAVQRVMNFVVRRAHHDTFPYMLLTLVSIALFLTFSRAAWIGAIGILVVAVWRYLSWKRRTILFFVSCTLLVLFGLIAQDVLLRAASTRGHLEKPLAAIQTIIAHPFGLGLGAAGPASNRVSDACVYLESGADASWAKDRQNLCVFSGDTQVQPTNRLCNCSFLPEDWYLQIGVELGVIGFILFLTLVILIILRTQEQVRLMFLGISIAALFLHAWEDSATTYTAWMLLISALPSFYVATAAVPAGARVR